MVNPNRILWPCSSGKFIGECFTNSSDMPIARRGAKVVALPVSEVRHAGMAAAGNSMRPGPNPQPPSPPGPPT